MRAINLILLLLIASSALTDAQVPAPPQTARQALLEMVLAKSPGAFERHLPEAARNALRHGGDTFQMPVLRELTAFRNGFLNPGQQLETFDSGPLLLTVDEKEANRHVEIGVERDDLMGDLDEIELSYHAYVDGKPELMPVKPGIVLSMGQENDVWKLNEVTVAMHVPLSDPDYLRDVQKSQNPALESVAVASLRTIEAAEISYSASFPQRGFTCNLAELGGASSQEEPSPQHAMLIDDALASGSRSAYIFSINGCDVAPASKFRVAAVPADRDLELRAFCSDESATIRYASDGKAASCLSAGVPLE